MGRVATLASRAFLLLLSLIVVAPLALLVVDALKPAQEFASSPFGLPSRLTFDNIASAWTDGEYFQAYLNSASIGISVILIVCVSAGLCSYSLAKMEFRGKAVVLVWLFLSISVPLGMFLVPLFYVYQHLGLMDTRIGLILIYSGVFLPFHVLLLRSYFVGIPNELGDSARLDGAGEIQVLAYIYVPLARPVFLTVALLIGLWSWNEFFFANGFIQSLDKQTVALKYLTFAGNYQSDWSRILAGGLITIAPMVALYLLLQRRFIDGLTQGGLKG